MPKDFHQQLLASEEFATYSLRSTFFFRKVRETRLWQAIHEVGKLQKVAANFDWNERRSWGITGDAWDKLPNSS